MGTRITLNDLQQLAQRVDGYVQVRSDGKMTRYWLAIGGDEFYFDKKERMNWFLQGIVFGVSLQQHPDAEKVPMPPTNGKGEFIKDLTFDSVPTNASTP